MRNGSRWDAIALSAVAFLCVLLAFIVYWPRLGDFFVWDDFSLLRAVRNHSFWTVAYRAFTLPKAKPFDEVTPFWRPLTDVYFYAMRPVGLHPEPYHVENVLAHAGVAALALLLVYRLTASQLTSILTALLFVVAPTYGFAVTWISQVSELLGAALTLCALISYHASLTSSTPGKVYYRATMAFTILAFLSKESTVILGVLLPAVAVAAGNDRQRTANEVVRGLLPLGVLAGVFALAMSLHQRAEGGGEYSLGWHMAGNLWDYLRWLVLPYERLPYPAHDAFLVLRSVLACVFLAAVFVAFVTRRRAVAFFGLWTIVALLPFVGFTFVGTRYTYLAALPFVAFVVSGLVALARALPSRVQVAGAPAVGAAIVAVLIVTPIHTRHEQLVLARQAAAYQLMVESVQGLCGELAPQSHVYVVGAPYRDLYGIHTPAAVNLYYDRVYADAVDRLPALVAYVEPKCVIEYDPGAKRYHRIPVG